MLLNTKASVIQCATNAHLSMAMINGIMKRFLVPNTELSFHHRTDGDGFVVQGVVHSNLVKEAVEALHEQGAMAVVELETMVWIRQTE